MKQKRTQMLNLEPQESQKPELGIFIKISVKICTMELCFLSYTNSPNSLLQIIFIH